MTQGQVDICENANDSDALGMNVQRGVQQAAGSEEIPPSGRVCAKCGRLVADPLLSNCPRPCGALLKGHTLTLRHGGRSARVQAGLMPSQAETLAALAERRQAIVADLGGDGALSTMAADLVTRYLELGMVADYLSGNLQRLGPLTGKGRQRAALTAWLAVVDRQLKLAAQLGLDRRTKDANTGSLRDYIGAAAD